MFPAPPEAVSKYYVHLHCFFFLLKIKLYCCINVYICLFTGYTDGYLNVYSETHVDIFYAASGEWLQTLNVKKVSLCLLNLR